MRFITIAALAVALLFTSCTDSDLDATGSPTPTPTETGLPAGWTECTNAELGYTIGYPDDWFTASTSAQNECRWFNRTPFELQEGSEAPATDMVIVPIERPYDEQAAVLGAGSDERTISREDTTIGGRDAIKFEIEQTNDGFFPEGTLFFGFLVDGPGVALLIETIDIGGAPYVDNQHIILTAVGTLRF